MTNCFDLENISHNSPPEYMQSPPKYMKSPASKLLVHTTFSPPLSSNKREMILEVNLAHNIYK